MQFIPNHVSARYLSSRVTLVISALQSPALRSSSLPHAHTREKHMKTLCICKSSHVIPFPLMHRFLFYSLDLISYSFSFNCIFHPHVGSNTSSRQIFGQNTCIHPPDKRLMKQQVENGSVLRLTDKAVTKTTERSCAFARLFNAGPKLYSYAHCTEK